MIVNIKKDGILYAKYNKQENHILDIRKYLNSTCKLDEGIVLKDIFLLCKKHADYLSPILTRSNRNLEKIINEGLNNKSKQLSDLESLELRWEINITHYPDEENPYLDISSSFVGLGPVPNNKEYSDWPSDNISYALEMTASDKLINLPIKINEYFNMIDERKEPLKVQAASIIRKEFTLLDILFGVFWELSFFGSPKERDLKKAELQESIDKIKNGEASFLSWEEVKENLSKKV